jgi:hypothetical protein
MPTVINGSGSIAGLQLGGLNDGIVTQSELATGVVGTGPAFRVYQTVAQNVPNADTVISFDTKEFDTANAFSTATNRFQPQVAGYYLFAGTVQIGGSATTLVLRPLQEW